VIDKLPYGLLPNISSIYAAVCPFKEVHIQYSEWLRTVQSRKKSLWRGDFPQPSRPTLGPTQQPWTRIRALSLAVRRLTCDVKRLVYYYCTATATVTTTAAATATATITATATTDIATTTVTTTATAAITITVTATTTDIATTCVTTVRKKLCLMFYDFNATCFGPQTRSHHWVYKTPNKNYHLNLICSILLKM
jgi:hypothetical protein